MYIKHYIIINKNLRQILQNYTINFTLPTVDSCTCECDGNFYSTSGSYHCETYTQRTAFLAAQTMICPLGTAFDVYECTCNHKSDTICAPECPGLKSVSHGYEDAGMYFL